VALPTFCWAEVLGGEGGASSDRFPCPGRRLAARICRQWGHGLLPQQKVGRAIFCDQRHGVESARARALAALAPGLPERLLAAAWDAALALEGDRDRAAALAALAPRLPEGQAAAAWDAALAALAPRLPERLLAAAWDAALALEGDRDRARALKALAPCLPERLLEVIAQPHICGRWHQYPLPDPGLCNDFLVLTLDAQAPVHGLRSTAVILSSLQNSLPADQLRSVWRMILHVLSLGSRSEVYAFVYDNPSLLRDYATGATVIEIVKAIQDVGRW